MKEVLHLPQLFHEIGRPLYHLHTHLLLTFEFGIKFLDPVLRVLQFISESSDLLRVVIFKDHLVQRAALVVLNLLQA